MCIRDSAISAQVRRGRPIAVLFATVVVGALVGAMTGAVSGANASTRGRIQQGAFHSSALRGTLRYAVWLPRGYTTYPTRRYPVLYVLHGLPGGEYSYRSLLFLVPVLDRINAQAIVVFPQGARRGDSDDEYLDLGVGRDWASALTRELTVAIASRYRTFNTRDARGLIGISAGGYGATILGLHNLSRYRLIESWSGYFHATNPDGSAPMPLSARMARWGNAHALVSGLARRFSRYRTFLGFYTGNRDPYAGFVAENERFDKELRDAHIPHRFAVYPGGHDTGLWHAHATAWLRLAVGSLRKAS